MRNYLCLTILLVCMGMALLPIESSCQYAAAQDEAAAAEAEAKLVRVEPADIGPKKGRFDADLDSIDGDAKEGAGSAEGSKSGSADTNANSAKGAALEIIFDCSNSMNARLNGVPKIDLAKQALYHLTDTLENTNLQIGFRLFGHDRAIDREDKVKGCINSELVIPIGASNAAKIRSRIPSLIAWGRTPIAYSLEEAGKDLDPHLENSPMVLLISDGLESCGRDPIRTILELKDRGVNVRTFVIGFDLNAEERAALEQIAAAGNGRYYNASDYSELVRSFDQFATDAALTPGAAAPKQEKYSNPSQGGASFAESTVIVPGRHTVWKDLGKGEWGYFKVESKKGHRVAVRAVVQGKAIYRDDNGEFHEAKYSEGGAMIRFYEPEGKAITGRNILLRGQIGEWQRQHTLDVSGEESYFAIGDDYGPTSRHVMFEVIVQEAGDLYEGWEAPNSKDSDEIFTAPLNDPFYGHLGTEDAFDLYQLDLKAAGNPATVGLSIKFSDVDEPCKFLIEVLDATTKRRIARFTKLESEAELELPTAGLDACILSIKDNNPKLYHLMNSYRIELKAGK